MSLMGSFTIWMSKLFAKMSNSGTAQVISRRKKKRLMKKNAGLSWLNCCRVRLTLPGSDFRPRFNLLRRATELFAFFLRLMPPTFSWNTATIARLESSKQKAVPSQSSVIDLSEESFRAALLRGLTLEETVTTDRQSDRVRVVLQDRATGLAGSLWVPL